MRSVERRDFLKLTASLPFASPLRSLAEVAPPLGKPVFVGTGADATGTEHHGPRAGTHLDFKVLTKDTLAGFFLLEHRDVPQGGPVRHLHYAQEEWFYLIEGNKVVIEVGDERSPFGRATPFLRHGMCRMFGPTWERSQDGC